MQLSLGIGQCAQPLGKGSQPGNLDEFAQEKWQFLGFRTIFGAV